MEGLPNGSARSSRRLALCGLRHLALTAFLDQPAVVFQPLLARLLYPALLGAIPLKLTLTQLLALVRPMLRTARLLLKPTRRLIAFVLRALLLLDPASLVLVALGALLLLGAVPLTGLLVARAMVVLALLFAGALFLLMPRLLGLLA